MFSRRVRPTLPSFSVAPMTATVSGFNIRLMSPFLMTTHPVGVDQLNCSRDEKPGPQSRCFVSGFPEQRLHPDSSVLDLFGICNHPEWLETRRLGCWQY